MSTNDRERWFSGDPSQPFRSDAPLSPTYQRLIIDWLIGKDIGQGVTWHSRVRLDDRNLPEFEQKALSILNEHLFSLRLSRSRRPYDRCHLALRRCWLGAAHPRWRGTHHGRNNSLIAIETRFSVPSSTRIQSPGVRKLTGQPTSRTAPWSRPVTEPTRRCRRSI